MQLEVLHPEKIRGNIWVHKLKKQRLSHSLNQVLWSYRCKLQKSVLLQVLLTEIWIANWCCASLEHHNLIGLICCCCWMWPFLNRIQIYDLFVFYVPPVNPSVPLWWRIQASPFQAFEELGVLILDFSGCRRRVHRKSLETVLCSHEILALYFLKLNMQFEVRSLMQFNGWTVKCSSNIGGLEGFSLLFYFYAWYLLHRWEKLNLTTLLILMASLVCLCGLQIILLMVKVLCYWRKWWSLIVGRNLLQ